MMSRKHYTAIAEKFLSERMVALVLYSADEFRVAAYTLDVMISRMADVFEADNLRFNRGMFEQASGYKTYL